MLFSVILIDPLVGNKLLFTWLPQNPEITLLAPCFAAGSIFTLFKDKIEIDIRGLAGVWFFYFLFRVSPYNFYFFYLAIFYSILFISSRKILVRFKPSIDISYGLYLWGWPVQQVMAQYFPEHRIWFNQIASTIIAAFFGFFSWHLIESRFIKIGVNFGKRISSESERQFQ